MATDLRGRAKNENKRSDGIAATRNGERREKRASVRPPAAIASPPLSTPAPGEREGACCGWMNNYR